MGRIIAYTIFSAMVVGALAYMIYDNFRFSAASSWQSVEGQITESGVISRGGVRTAESHVPSIAYAYTVGGRNFSGYSIWLTAKNSFSTAEEADDFLSAYRLGSQVRVYFDPANPADSALVVGRGGDPMVMFILAGIWGLIGTYHSTRRGNSAEGRATQRPGQPPMEGNAVEITPARIRWGSMFGQMAVAALIVSSGFVVYVLLTGPG